MNEAQQELRRKIDLHFGRQDFSSNSNYVEFSFYCCFYEVFAIPNSYWTTSLTGAEIVEILNILKININLDFVKEKYFDNNNHNVEVFHSYEDEQVFIYFDLQKEPTDQNDMFFLGIRCTKHQEEIIHEKLLKMYKKLQTCSPFTFDIYNNQLYYKVFLSFFYFYNNKYNELNRQIRHHTN